MHGGRQGHAPAIGDSLKNLEKMQWFHYNPPMTNFKPINDWYIRINGNEHGMAHVHVVFRDGSKVSISIEGREVLAGSVKPAHRLNEVRQNIAEHAATYLAEYRRLNP